MAAGLVLPISGPYTATWDFDPLGVMSDDGYEVLCTIQGQEVNETDAWGLTLVEAIYRGQNWRCRGRGVEWNRPGLLELVQSFGKSLPAKTLLNPIIAQVGQRWTVFSKILVLTGTLANPPSTPASLTAASAAFAPNYQTSWLYTSKLREFPFEMVFIPYEVDEEGGGGNKLAIPFSTT